VVAGFVIGIAAAFLFRVLQVKSAGGFAREILREKEEERRTDMEAIMAHMKASFGSLSLEALSRSTEEFLKLARASLESERQVNVRELEVRKGLIDQELHRMTADLDNVARLMKEFEKDRAEKFGELTRHLRVTGEQTALLAQTLATLKEALAGSKARGQWGERMAEDILRVAGLIEHINYIKQGTIEGVGRRPDFTFLLPRGLRLNMEVKFPFDNYMRFLAAAGEAEKVRFRADFLRDVKAKIREVTTREYINPEQNTVDCVLLLIPNEQVYAFIQEQDGLILEEGIRRGVVCCSPATLFAVLAVIRQAVDAFSLEQTSNEIVSLLGNFKKQWEEFLKRLELMGRRIGELHKEFEVLNGTRRRQLERPLERIEAIRHERGLGLAPPEGEGGEGSEEGG
jgi:DNA recombination protein RmuC